jgi:hypothetical protein
MGLPFLALLDEPGVLGKAARVEKERLPEAVAQRPYAAQVGQRHRLPAAGVVRHRDDDQRDTIAVAVQRRFEFGEIHVALERMQHRRLASFRDHEVARLGLFDLDVRARRIEVVVVGHDLAGQQDRVEQNALGCPPLVRRDDVGEAGQFPHDALEAEERSAAGVGLVAVDQRGPLRQRHRAGPGIGEQIDQNVLRRKLEDVVTCTRQRRDPLIACRELPRLDRLDAERLDDRVERMHG